MTVDLLNFTKKDEIKHFLKGMRVVPGSEQGTQHVLQQVRTVMLASSLAPATMCRTRIMFERRARGDLRKTDLLPNIYIWVQHRNFGNLTLKIRGGAVAGECYKQQRNEDKLR